MASGFFAAWRDQRRLRRNTAAYVLSLAQDPDPSDVSWLSSAATGGDSDRARWELRFARRACGQLVAERDALDDRTASAVSREIATGWSKDRNVGAGMRDTAEQQFTARLRVLGQAMSARSSPEPTGTRLGKALLVAAGSSAPSAQDIARGGAIVGRYLEQANEALRRAFGTATLPENLPPSAMVGPSATSRR